MRRAGPDRSDQKKTSVGLVSSLKRLALLVEAAREGTLLFPANRPRKLHSVTDG